MGRGIRVDVNPFECSAAYIHHRYIPKALFYQDQPARGVEAQTPFDPGWIASFVVAKNDRNDSFAG